VLIVQADDVSLKLPEISCMHGKTGLTGTSSQYWADGLANIESKLFLMSAFR
jgi:hypothetical protein